MIKPKVETISDISFINSLCSSVRNIIRLLSQVNLEWIDQYNIISFIHFSYLQVGSSCISEYFISDTFIVNFYVFLSFILLCIMPIDIEQVNLIYDGTRPVIETRVSMSIECIFYLVILSCLPIREQIDDVLDFILS